jgi:hypothetical protein
LVLWAGTTKRSIFSVDYNHNWQLNHYTRDSSLGIDKTADYLESPMVDKSQPLICVLTEKTDTDRQNNLEILKKQNLTSQIVVPISEWSGITNGKAFVKMLPYSNLVIAAREK